MDDRDLEERVCRALTAEQLLSEEGEEGEVIDDGLGDSSPGVADDRSVSELESEDDGRVDPVVEAGDDEHLRRGQAERHGGVGTGELLIALEQGLHPGHGGSVPLKGYRWMGAEVPTPWRTAMSRMAAARRSGYSLVVR